MNGCLVVILDFSPKISFWYSDVVGTMLEGLEFCGAFVGGHDFGFRGNEGCLILTYLFPCNWSDRAIDEKTRETLKFEQFKRSAFFDCTTKLTTPVGIAENCELMAF